MVAGRSWRFLAAVLLVSGACVGETTSLPSGGLPDASDAGLGRDAAPLDAAPLDAEGFDADLPDADLADGGDDPCPCDLSDPTRGPVYTFGACIPPLEHGCLARTCELGADDCGEGYSCEPCAAAACCACSACRPACLRTQGPPGPLPELLKLRSTFGRPGTEQEITVEGAPFYIGALYYTLRVGDSDPTPESGSPGRCQLTFRAPARPPGMEPIWVSQYGGREPWVLAGFFRFGGEPPTCVQPGFQCEDARGCCETAAVPMTCTAGRCRQR